MIEIAYSDWLAPTEPDFTVAGITLDPAARTRKDEYRWVLEHIIEGAETVLDAAAGYIYDWHMLPYMLRNHGVKHVTACDMNKRTLDMPKAPGILRLCCNLKKLPFADRSFDVVCCISTLEHVPGSDLHRIIGELARVAKYQILLTADDAPGLPQVFHNGVRGSEEPPPGALVNPGVYAVDVRLL